MRQSTLNDVKSYELTGRGANPAEFSESKAEEAQKEERVDRRLDCLYWETFTIHFGKSIQMSSDFLPQFSATAPRLLNLFATIDFYSENGALTLLACRGLNSEKAPRIVTPTTNTGDLMGSHNIALSRSAPPLSHRVGCVWFRR
eukprot:scaffold4545_cov139-Amphora_coffeaeformis.AAC.9